jgi:nucleoside-diphosphate-sugar epimerase
MSTYLVTGAAGFIGSHLCEALEQAGHSVRGVDCFTDYYAADLKEQNAAGRAVVRADLAEAPLEPLLDGVDGVFHLAGQPGVRSFGDAFRGYVRHNLVASQRVFEAAAQAGVRVVFASSSSVYGEAEGYPTSEDARPRPISPYGITTLGCEHLARATELAFGLDAVLLRYFTVYGPRQRPDMAFTRILTALAQGTPFELYGDGSASRGFTYVADAVAATAAAMERGTTGAIYNVSGGAEATMREAIATCERVSGRTLDLRITPSAKGDVSRTAADTTRITEALGWRAEVGLEQGLAAHWSWVSAKVGRR